MGWGGSADCNDYESILVIQKYWDVPFTNIGFSLLMAKDVSFISLDLNDYIKMACLATCSCSRI